MTDTAESSAVDWRDEGADLSRLTTPPTGKWLERDADPVERAHDFLHPHVAGGEDVRHLVGSLAAALREAREREERREALREIYTHALDAYGAPCGETIQDRLRAWEQREREFREYARERRPADGELPEDGATVLAQWSDGGPVQPLDYADRFGRLAWWLGSIEVEPPARWWPLPPGAQS